MPATTSLPGWFWIIYYFFLIITFGVSIFAIMEKKKSGVIHNKFNNIDYYPCYKLY